MRDTFQIRKNARQNPRAGSNQTLHSLQCRIALIALILGLCIPAAAQQLTLATAPGGFPLSGGAGNAYAASFGTMNGIGAGTPSAGVTILPLTNGTLYYTSFSLVLPNVPGSHKAVVTAYMSGNFAHPAALIAESCQVNGACTSSSGYTQIGLSAATDTDLLPVPGLDNQTVQAGLAIFIPDNNGASAYTGTDSATITIRMFDSVKTGKQLGKSVTLTLNPQTVQTAVQLTLSSASGGATITPAADFNLNFGNVNALGIGPGAGFVTTSAAGGIIYYTPYLLKPAFSGFSSTTGTIQVYVSTDFAHPAVLALRDASSSAGPFSSISKTASPQTLITTTAASRSSVTRYLGLFVSNLNGASAFTGLDNATLTFTLTVP